MGEMSTESMLCADLFCGAGGTSTGLLQAMEALGLKVSLLAINHWNLAIETHSLNHPYVKHVCDSLENLNPKDLVQGGKLRILVASPECTHFSTARGGKPMSKQSRATVKHVLRWLRNLDVQDVLIENVTEFQTWGPLHREGPDAGHPIKSRKGQFFKAFIRSLTQIGYHVEWRVLCAADYGDPTTRKRLFIRASKRQNPICWPVPTHVSPKRAQLPMFGHSMDLHPWRPARDIIDWSDLGTSIFNRERPLSPNTLRRIEVGLRKFAGLPFVLPLEGFFRGNQPRSVDDPLPTITAGRGAGGVVNPFLVKLYKGSDGVSVDQPLPTVTAEWNHLGVVNPFVVKMRGTSDAESIDAPVPTLTAQGNHVGVVSPFIVQVEHGGKVDHRVYPPDRPLPTITNRSGMGIVNPFILNLRGGKDGYTRGAPVSEPMGALTNHPAQALVNAFLVEYHGASYEGGDRARSLDEPLSTVAAGGNQHGLAFLVKYYGIGVGQSVSEPLGTVTSKDHFALCVAVEDDTYLLDILFRMLKPKEMSAAHSFPEWYEFRGSRENKVKQIGNSVPVRLAKALTLSIMQ